jgi:hypothetical protein
MEKHEYNSITYSVGKNTARAREVVGGVVRTFEFDKISGYTGQSSKEMGLFPGKPIDMFLGPDNITVSCVEFEFDNRSKKIGPFTLPFQDLLDLPQIRLPFRDRLDSLRSRFS